MNSSSLRRALLSLGLVLSVTASSALADGPANDFFVSAETIAGASGSLTRPIEAIDGAGAEIGEPVHAGVGGISVWYNWTAPVSGAAAFDSFGSEFDTILAVYTGNSVVNLTKIAANDNDAASGDVTSRVVFPITAGTTYRIAFVGQDGAVGAYNLHWQTTSAGMLRFSKTAYRVSEDGSVASDVIRIERIGSTAGIASVDIETVAETATTEDDYTPITNTLSFTAGQDQRTITLVVANDDTDEGDETLKLVLSNPVNAFLSIEDEAVVTIDDDEDNPVNDKFADAFVMDGAMGNNVGTNVGAGTEANEPVHGGVGSGRSIWYRWTATGTGVLLLDTDSSTIGLSDPLDTVISVYTGTVLGSLVSVASNDNAGLDDVTSRLAIPVVTGTTYYIAVDSKETGGAINFNWNFSSGGFFDLSQLDYTVNEDGGSVQITVTRSPGTTTSASVTYATEDGSAIAGQHYVGIAPTVLNFAAGETSRTFYVTILNNTDLGDRAFKIKLSAPTGDALLGTTTEATLTIDDDEDLPPNDRFASAAVISGDFGNTDAGNVGARQETGEPSHGPGSAHSVWFKWRAPATGVVTFDTAESTNLDNDPLDTLLAVYTGAFLNTLSAVVKNDNTETSVTSRVSFPVKAGTTYYIAVAGKNGAEGDIHLIWNFGAGGLIQFSQAEYSVNEKGAPQATITVARVDGSTGTVKVDFTVEDGTATEGDDYLAPTGSNTLTFLPGQTSRTFTIPIIDDAVVDGSDETVALSLGNVQGGAILGNLSAATLTINDNEDDPTNDNLATPLNLSATTSPKIYVNSGASREAAEPLHGGVNGNRSLWFKWTAPANGVAVFDTAGSVASGATPLDTVFAVYTGGPGYDKLVAVGANDDASGDTVTSRLSFVTKANVTYLIAVDSDGLVGGEIHLAWTHSAGGIIQFAAPIFNGREGTTARLVVNRVGSPSGAVGASYAAQVLAGGNATQPSDFPVATGSVSFANGQSSAFIDIALPTDSAVEGDESFAVVLTNPTGGSVLGAASAEVKIDDANDDPANDNFAAAQALVGASGSVNGTNAGAGFEAGETAERSPAGHSIWYKWVAPSSGLATFSTAGSGTLVLPLDTVLTVSSGSTLAAQLTLVSSDDLSETDLSSEVSFAAVAGTTYYISIDAFPPFGGTTKLNWSLATGGSFVFSSATYRGEENTPAGVEITVTRSGTTVNPATVDYATSNGTAIAGQDYTAKTGTLQFAPGQSVRSFMVPITNDPDVETDENFTVTLSNPSSGGSLGALITATVTVFDNDVVVEGDKFAEALVLTETSGETNTTNTGAGREVGENLPGFVLKNLGSGRTVWFSWKAPTAGNFTFHTTGSTTADSQVLDTVMAVYTGSSLSNLTLVAENDEKPDEGVVSEVTFRAIAGRTYYIAVDTIGDASGDIQLHWEAGESDVASLFALSPDFKPTLTFKETYGEKLVGNPDDGYVTEGTVNYSATFVVSLRDLDITGLDASTPVSITIGGVEQTAVLGDDPAFVANPALKKNSATIPIIDSDENELGTVKYAWDATKLTVTITGKNLNLMAIAAPNNVGTEPIVDQELGATLTFAGLSGSRTVYFDGSASISTKHMPDDSDYDVATVSISGSADYSAPTVAFKTPAANFRTSATTIKVTGTANENIGFEDVMMRVNNEGDFESITTEWLDENGKKYGWSAEEVPLRAGPNLIEVKAIDFSGNETIASRTIIRVAPSTIALQTVGQGTIKTNFTGTQLEVGKNYTVTATPAAGWVFKNWSGGLNSTDAKFSFDMPDGGLTLTANFVENPFLNLKGDFTGLVRPGTFNPALTGAFELTLTGTGGITGKLNLGAENVPFKGQFDDSGFTTIVVPRKGKTPLILTFQLDLAGGTEQINGTITDGVFTSSIASDRIVFNAKTNRAPQEGTYTVILPGGASLRDSNLEFGHGFLTMTVAANGSARLAGNLADSATLSFSAQISKSGVMQVYATPKNTVVAGSVLFGATPAAGANGMLNWYRNTVGAVAGLDAEILFAAESYAKPAKNVRVIPSLPTATSALFGAGYATELTQTLTIGTDNKVVVSAAGNTGLLSLTINPAAGTFTGTIRKVGTPNKTLPVKGALLQGTAIGAGYFVDGATSGYFTIGPVVP